MNTATQFVDEETNPDARPLNDLDAAASEWRANADPRVLDWVRGFAKHAPKSKHDAAFIAGWVAGEEAMTSATRNSAKETLHDRR